MHSTPAVSRSVTSVDAISRVSQPDFLGASAPLFPAPGQTATEPTAPEPPFEPGRRTLPDGQILAVFVTGPSSVGCVRVVAVGEVDHETAPLLRACLMHQLHGRGPTEVVVDLVGVSFLNAGGLAVLAAAVEQAARTGTTLTVRCDPRRTVHRLLRITGLIYQLRLEPSGMPIGVPYAAAP